MAHHSSRRTFLRAIGHGTFLATLGSSLAVDLGFVPVAFANDLDDSLKFGELEPLVCELQETPIERLQSELVQKVRSGLPLKTLIAAGALANARTFGGEDYIGFHTFMALAPALHLSSLMPDESAMLPVLKVLYRNTYRIQEFGGRDAEVLREIPHGSSSLDGPESLGISFRNRNIEEGEQKLANLIDRDRQLALDALIPIVQDTHPEVHRTVLPFRAWEMQRIVGTEHALTLLRQSLRYCVRLEPQHRAETTAHGVMLVSLMDQYKLHGKQPGKKPAETALVEEWSRTFATGSPEDAGRAAAIACAEGFTPQSIGEAISLAASKLVLRDGGRLPQWEDRLKLAGTVHGDSVGVHASDAANAWRNLSQVVSGPNVFACLIIGAWQVARDRQQPGNLLADALPAKHHIDQVRETDDKKLLAELEEAIESNLQGHATAIAYQYGELGLSADAILRTLARYAVSEDGALHAEKYFQTVWDDFQITRPELRWQHIVSLARVTASEYGRAAAGQAEARELLGLKL